MLPAEGVPCRPTSGPGLRQRGGTAAGPVYSAVGLPRSREREDVFRASLIMTALGRDKQARPSRDAAAPAAGGGKGTEEKVGGLCGKASGARGEVDSHSRGYSITLALWFYIRMAAQACKSTFFVWSDANRPHEPEAHLFLDCVVYFLKDDAFAYVHALGSSHVFLSRRNIPLSTRFTLLALFTFTVAVFLVPF